MENYFIMPEYSYLDTIKFLASTNSDKVFKNKGTENAEIVLSEMFNNAKKEVFIFAGNCKGDVSNSEIYNEAIINFLKNTSGIVKVFLENNIKKAENFKVYQTLNENTLINNGRVYLKKADNNFIDAVKLFFNDKYHFFVADRKMYRVETNTDTFKAICSFNSPEFCEKLSTLFLKHFD